MSTNLFARLQKLLPPSPVLIGRVTAHHDEDDTSTVELPTGQGVSPFGSGVSSGSFIRARGRFVPVGENAFVRDGVIETRAPDGDITETVVGRTTPPMSPLIFDGPISAQFPNLGGAFSFALASYWSGGTPPYAFSVAAGTLPAGLTLNPLTGTITGTATALGSSAGIVFRVVDSLGASADSNPMSFTVVSGLTFAGPIADQELTVSVPFMLSLVPFWAGAAPPTTYALTAGTLPAGLSLNSSTGVISGTPTTVQTLTGLTFQATDSAPASVPSNAVQFRVSPALVGSGGTTISIPANVSYSIEFAPFFSGGRGTLTYSVFTGTLPVGLIFNSATGEVSGSPVAGSYYYVKIQATDVDGRTALTGSFGWNVVTGDEPPARPVVLYTGDLAPQDAPLKALPVVFSGFGTRTFNVSVLFEGGVAPLTYQIVPPAPTAPGSSPFPDVADFWINPTSGDVTVFYIAGEPFAYDGIGIRVQCVDGLGRQARLSTEPDVGGPAAYATFSWVPPSFIGAV